jgi:CheY-like chemotaxis protein
MLIYIPMQKSILVIDDDEDDLSFLKEAFLEAGFQFIVYDAPSGKLGLGLLNNLKIYPPSIVIMDIKIAVMDRFEILNIIREEHGIPILVYATVCTKAITENLKAKGATDCLKKSNSLAELKEAVRKITEHID